MSRLNTDLLQHAFHGLRLDAQLLGSGHDLCLQLLPLYFVHRFDIHLRHLAHTPVLAIQTRHDEGVEQEAPVAPLRQNADFVNQQKQKLESAEKLTLGCTLYFLSLGVLQDTFNDLSVVEHRIIKKIDKRALGLLTTSFV